MTVPQDEAWDPGPMVKRRPVVPRRLEKDVVAAGIALLRTLPRGYAHKVHGGQFGNAGEPDVDACVNGRACKFEAKTGRNRPTDVQIGAMRRWAATGALVGWFTGNDHLRQLLDHLDDPDFVPDLNKPGCSCPVHQAGSA